MATAGAIETGSTHAHSGLKGFAVATVSVFALKTKIASMTMTVKGMAAVTVHGVSIKTRHGQVALSSSTGFEATAGANRSGS